MDLIMGEYDSNLARPATNAKCISKIVLQQTFTNNNIYSVADYLPTWIRYVLYMYAQLHCRYIIDTSTSNNKSRDKIYLLKQILIHKHNSEYYCYIVWSVCTLFSAVQQIKYWNHWNYSRRIKDLNCWPQTANAFQ